MKITGVILLLVVATYAFPEHERERRMIGGQPAKEGSLPSTVWIRRENSGVVTKSCLGSILNNQWILTSAHCVIEKDTENVDVIPDVYTHTSNPSQPKYKPDVIHIHDQFDSNTGKNDIALIHLATPIVFSKTVSPAKLGKLDQAKGSKVHAIGWNEQPEGGLGEGKPTAPRLATLPLTLTTLDHCIDASHNLINLDEKTQICANPGKGNDLCGVDSGAPLINEETGEQVGIVNDAIFFASGHNHQCHPDHDHPLFFTNLEPYFEDFISKKTGIQL